jgi:hypothetical protein
MGFVWPEGLNVATFPPIRMNTALACANGIWKSLVHVTDDRHVCPRRRIERAGLVAGRQQ